MRSAWQLLVLVNAWSATAAPQSGQAISERSDNPDLVLKRVPGAPSLQKVQCGDGDQWRTHSTFQGSVSRPDPSYVHNPDAETIAAAKKAFEAAWKSGMRWKRRSTTDGRGDYLMTTMYVPGKGFFYSSIPDGPKIGDLKAQPAANDAPSWARAINHNPTRNDMYFHSEDGAMQKFEASLTAQERAQLLQNGARYPPNTIIRTYGVRDYVDPRHTNERSMTPRTGSGNYADPPQQATEIMPCTPGEMNKVPACSQAMQTLGITRLTPRPNVQQDGPPSDGSDYDGDDIDWDSIQVQRKRSTSSDSVKRFVGLLRRVVSRSPFDIISGGDDHPTGGGRGDGTPDTTTGANSGGTNSPNGGGTSGGGGGTSGADTNGGGGGKPGDTGKPGGTTDSNTGSADNNPDPYAAGPPKDMDDLVAREKKDPTYSPTEDQLGGLPAKACSKP